MSNFNAFIQEIDNVVKKNESEEIVTKKVAAILGEFLDKDIVPQEYMQPNAEKYMLYPLYIAPDNSFSIASAVWDVNQSTPIHNHGTWGVIGLIQGKESEVHYAPPTPGEPIKELATHELDEGEVKVCCTSDQDVHKVSCISSVPCIGIHIYGANIGEIERSVYNEDTGEERRVVTSWDEVPTL